MDEIIHGYGASYSFKGGRVGGGLYGKPMLLDGKKGKALLFAGSQYARLSYIP